MIERIAALPNVELHVGSEIKSLNENEQFRLEALLENTNEQTHRTLTLRKVFMFLGADPNASWLPPEVSIDDKGFVRTGTAFGPDTQLAIRRSVLSLETSVPNVFAIGDVRSGSTKRVAAAVGDGAAVVSEIHSALRAMAK